MEDAEKKAIPFLRWAGGKRWFLKYLDAILLNEYNNYHEPFLGGGAIFFHLEHNNRVFLSDLNEELIEAYFCLKERVDDVIDVLSNFKNTENYYYKIRGTKFQKDFQRAARFIYLNRTSFNGIYRVNSKGEYNVPFGFRINLEIVDEVNLRAVSKKLHNAELRSQDFTNVIDNVTEGDLIFFDPPYTVAHENNGFIAYNQKIFSLEDQEKLALLIQQIEEIGAYYIMTNAKHDAVKKIYSNINDPMILSRSSTIGGIGARREQFKEYIFTNFI
jgi:DNA adenine methylase